LQLCFIFFNVLIPFLAFPSWRSFICSQCLLVPLWPYMCKLQFCCFCLRFNKWWYDWLSTMRWKCPDIYGNYVNAIIRTVGNTTMHCTVRQPLLQNMLPELAKLLYETYLQKKESSVYILRKLRTQRKFILNEDNENFHIIKRSGKNKILHLFIRFFSDVSVEKT